MLIQTPEDPTQVPAADPVLPPGVDQATADLVATWISRVERRRSKSKEAFDKMEMARHLATYGATADWYDSRYTANIIGPHIASQSSALYARNPTVICKPKKMLDFAVWDGSPESLMAAQQVAQTLPPEQLQALAQVDPAIAQAVDLLQDYQEGNLKRKLRIGVAKTVALAIQDTWELGFKMSLKQAVRRSLTTGIAYVRPDIYRSTSRDPRILAQINDTRTQLAEIEAMIAQLKADEAEGDIAEMDARREELARVVESLEQQGETVEEEGINYSFPDSDSIIFDEDCRSVITFEGAKWGAERLKGMTRKTVLSSYGIDVNMNDATGVPRPADGSMVNSGRYAAGQIEGSSDSNEDRPVDVFEVWHKPTRTRFVICKQWSGYLEPPAPPPAYSRRFWPWVPIVFNGQELPTGQVFPPSDAMQLRDPQEEVNNARQGLREHRKAARPIYIAAPGLLDEEIQRIHELPAFSVMRASAFTPGTKVTDLMAQVPKAPIDPGVYDTSPHQRDMELIGGSMSAQLGAVSGSTATENAIAAESRDKEVMDGKDGLDDALSTLAEMVGQMMLDSFDAATVIRMVGSGAVWPDLTRREIANELMITIRAGSSGRPNKAMDIANMERLAPFLQLIPGISPIWLARTMIERLEDDIDLDEALSPGIPAIATINQIDKANAAPPPAPPGAAGALADAEAPAGNEPPPGEGTEVTEGANGFRRVSPGPQAAFDSSGNLP